MSQLTINEDRTAAEEPEGKLASQIPLGTVFYGRIQDDDDDRLMMKVYELIFDLRHPSRTWVVKGDGTLRVRRYRPARAATLRVVA